MNSDFMVWPFRFHLKALAPVCFPPGKAGNILRGAFGTIFRQMACIPGCNGVHSCEIAGQCAYAQLFEPRQEWSNRQNGPSGLADWPRPFVFRALHLDGTRIHPDESFYFDVVLFDEPGKVLPYFVLVFRQLAEAGLGPSRGQAALELVEDLTNGTVVFDGHRMRDTTLPGKRFEFATADDDGLRSSYGETHRVLIRFQTPTELKAGGELALQLNLAS